MLRFRCLTTLTLVALATLGVAGRSTTEARAAANGLCPFCPSTSQTLSDEIAAMDAAVVVTLEAVTPSRHAGKAGGAGGASKADRPDDDVVRVRFRIVEVLKGERLLARQKTIETVFFGEPRMRQKYFLTGAGPENMQWSTPLPLSDRAHGYLRSLGKLPKSGAERLEFFQGHLEDDDELLASDAFDEFAKAPYDVVRALKPKMNHDQLVAWVTDPSIATSRRRLYLTLLGVCGSRQDLPLLEAMLKADDGKRKAGLDALIACYLLLKGPDGLPLVEGRFIVNPKAEYADTYAAIMALRFHGTDVQVIPREQIVAALRLMLDRPNLADLVIPDLIRWEDWSSIDKLVNLFKTADEKTTWVKVPVISYLRACPLPEAKARLQELEKLDPASVKRANAIFPPPAAGVRVKS